MERNDENNDGDNDIQDEGAPELYRRLTQNRTDRHALSVVRSDNTDMRGRILVLEGATPPANANAEGQGQAFLSRSLDALRRPSHLSLVNCSLGDADMQQLVTAVGFSWIVSLNLARNSVTAMGLQPLSFFLSQPTSRLQSINVARNRISGASEELSAFAHFMAAPEDDPPNRSVLEFVSLAGNPLGHDGTMMVADELQAACTVAVLDLSDTGMSVEAAHKLRDKQLIHDLAYLGIRRNPLLAHDEVLQSVERCNQARLVALLGR